MKIYGEDLKFLKIYEMIKMRVPISAEMKDYFMAEKDNYEFLKEDLANKTEV